MTIHHPPRNLRLHDKSTWQGKSVYTQRDHLIANYLEKIDHVICCATTDHRRSFVIRCDLHFCQYDHESDTAVISRFIDSLKAQLRAHEQRKYREGKRVHSCRLRYIWVKERSLSPNAHYHVVLFLNNDAFCTLGLMRRVQDYRNNHEEPCYPASDERNMVDRIRQAWASALDVSFKTASGLVHIPRNATYHLDANDAEFDSQFSELFYRLSYMAKLDTKHFGDRSKNFGSSRG